MKTNDSLSAVLVSIIILLNVPGLYAQNWSAPLSITDSLADNRNPVIVEIPFNGYYDHFIFWERSVDSTSSAIYYRNFYNTDELVGLLETENVHYRNPQFIQTHSLDEDTLFYFFYESDLSGNFDIYYMVYTVLGFGGPELLAGTQADESHFRCNGGGSMTWQEGDKIKYSSLQNWTKPFVISEPVTIDSINCSEPDVPPGPEYFSPSSYICWMKTLNDTSSIYYTYYTGAGSELVLLSDSGNNISPHFAMSSCNQEGIFGEIISWERIVEGEHNIKIHDLWEGDYTGNFSQQSSYFPSVALYTMPVDEFYATGFLAFVEADTQNSEIFVNEGDSWIPEDLEYYRNLSDSPFEETRPVFFSGRCFTYFCDLILIWESKRNDHWQLFYSLKNLGCAGSINESTELPAMNLSISPNPARKECDINYTINTDSPVSLRLCTLDGRQIPLTDDKFHQKGSYTYHLNFDQIFPGGNYSGLFMIRLQAGNSSVAQKMIKIN